MKFLRITIKDLSNRIVLSDNFKTNNFKITFDINFLEGLYLITFENEANQNVTKKLIVSK